MPRHWVASAFFTALATLPVFEFNSDGLQRGAAPCGRFAAQSLRSFGQPDRFATGASRYRFA